MPRYSFAHGVNGCLEMCPTPDYVKRLTSMITQAVTLASRRLESASSIVGARAAGWHRRIGSPMGGRVGSSVGPQVQCPRLVYGYDRHPRSPLVQNRTPRHAYGCSHHLRSPLRLERNARTRLWAQSAIRLAWRFRNGRPVALTDATDNLTAWRFRHERPVTPAGATSAGIGGDVFGLIRFRCSGNALGFERPLK